MNTWFTSDTHFNHKNIIPYERQGYPDVETMNRDMIARWNSKVQPGDIVFHLGDFALGRYADLAPIIYQLNGCIELCLGNHDWNARRMLEAGVNSAVQHRFIEVGTCRLSLAHIPSEYHDRTDRPLKRPEIEGYFDIELCGHVHSSWRSNIGEAESVAPYPIVNVGVDVWDMYPITFDQILEAAKEIS